MPASARRTNTEQQRPKGMLSKPPPKTETKKPVKKAAAPKGSSYLTRAQNSLINTQRTTDDRLGRQVQRSVHDAVQNVQQPFDYSQYDMPEGPDYSNVAAAFNPQDWNQWRQQQIDAAAQDFENQFGDQFKRQSDDFEQMAYERGWSPGSKVYEDSKAAMVKGQNDMRQSNLVQAMNQGASNASQFGNLAIGARAQGINDAGNMYGQQWGAYNNQISDAMGRRYQPLQEANMFRSAQSPLMMSDAQLANQMQLGNQQGQFALQAKRMGGGGGSPDWAQNGFSSYQDYAAFQDARTINLARQQAGLTQSNQPSPWWQFAGAAAGAAFS